MKPVAWLLGTKVYDVQQREDAGFGAFYPDQTAIYSEHAKETILSAIRQAKVEVLKKVIHVVETYKVSVGNSASGERAAEWTMENLKEVRDELRRMADEIERSKT